MLNRWTQFGLTVLVVALLGCSSTSDDANQADALDTLQTEDGVTSADSLDDTAEDISEIQEDVSSDTFPDLLAAHLRKAMDEYLAFSGDPGLSVAIRLPSGATFVEAAGVANITTGDAMNTHSSFRVGSNTKPFIAALVMMLVDEGLVGLDDPLSDYVSDYPAWDNVTVRMLLDMSSGIPDYLLSESFMMAAVFDPESLTTPDVLLNFVKDTEMVFEPGTQHIYSNTNYILIGLIIEEVTGEAAQDALRTRILDPLGLDDTYLDVVDETKPDLAHGYLDLAIVGFFFGLGADAVALLPPSWFMEDYLVDATYLFPPMFSWTDGGLVTTPEDSMKFMVALLTGDLITQESLAEMKTTNVTPILGTPVDYGMGLSTSTDFFGTRWGHGGLNFGYEANTIYFPERDVALSHMHNYLPEQSYRFEDDVLHILDSEPTQEPGPTCTVPENLFGTMEGDVVEFRFKGSIDGEGTAEPSPGTALVRGFLDGENLALYGYGTQAAEAQLAGARRINITSTAPALTEGVDLRTATISIAASALTGADGEVTLESPTDLAVIVMEVVTNPDSGDIDKMCVVAVPDLSRSARFSVCGGLDYEAKEGDLLRVFGVVPVTRDMDAINAFIALVPMPRCSCADGDGSFAECI